MGETVNVNWPYRWCCYIEAKDKDVVEKLWCQIAPEKEKENSSFIVSFSEDGKTVTHYFMSTVVNNNMSAEVTTKSVNKFNKYVHVIELDPDKNTSIDEVARGLGLVRFIEVIDG